MTMTATSGTSASARRARPVREVLRDASPDLDEIAARFEALDLEGRVAEMETLGAREQAHLWMLAAANPPLAVRDLLGEDARAVCIWEGVNTLPAFRRFQKRFAPTTDPERLAGYNQQALMLVTGPGCFTARATRDDEPASVVLDYTLTPGEQPAGFPKIVPADRGLSRFVYGGMLDYMHRVAPGVLIGRAWRNGKPSDNYFMLARAPR